MDTPLYDENGVSRPLTKLEELEVIQTAVERHVKKWSNVHNAATDPRKKAWAKRQLNHAQDHLRSINARIEAAKQTSTAP